MNRSKYTIDYDGTFYVLKKLTTWWIFSFYVTVEFSHDLSYLEQMYSELNKH